MERVQAEENRAVADGGAVAHAGPLARWLAGYLLVAAPVMATCAGVLDGPWASGFAYAVLLLGVGSVCCAVLPSRPMERVQAEEDRAAANADADSHQNIASPDKVMAWCGYLLVAAPMMGICAGLLDGPWAAGFAYAALLLGIASIYRAVFVFPLPPRRMDRVQAHDRHDAGNHQEAAFPKAAMTWCGYVLVAAPVMGSCAGLADTPGAALFGYALLLLGFAFIGLAMLPLRPMERMLQDETRPVGNGNRRREEAVVRGAGTKTITMDWTGYFVVTAPVVASWAGLVEGPAATFFAFALLLLGITFVIMAMLAVAKPKMA